MNNCSYDDTQEECFYGEKVPDITLSAEEITEKVLHAKPSFNAPGFIFWKQ